MILVMDTSAENVFIGLWDKTNHTWSRRDEFTGGRELNALIIKKLELSKITLTGIIIAAGPGSFTGLRIGLSVANTLAYVRDIPIVAPHDSISVEGLLQKGLSMLKSRGASFGGAVRPHYGAEPHITVPKKG